jgi:hypothetical protein
MYILLLNWGAITSTAWVIVVVGYLICFVALALLVIVFSNFPKLEQMFKNIGRKKQVAINQPAINNSHIPVQDAVAISAALHLYFDEIHDTDEAIMTIRKIKKSYSPWNSKLYGLNNFYWGKSQK